MAALLSCQGKFQICNLLALLLKRNSQDSVCVHISELVHGQVQHE